MLARSRPTAERLHGASSTAAAANEVATGRFEVVCQLRSVVDLHMALALQGQLTLFAANILRAYRKFQNTVWNYREQSCFAQLCMIAGKFCSPLRLSYEHIILPMDRILKK